MILYYTKIQAKPSLGCQYILVNVQRKDVTSLKRDLALTLAFSVLIPDTNEVAVAEWHSDLPYPIRTRNPHCAPRLSGGLTGKHRAFPEAEATPD